ncbi:MAG: hypothetical protein SVK08_01885 [Halobacteriota archaeon]|nr:hypothetical protein [Halobacteriota archaeon]
MTYERRGVTVVQELRSASVILNEPELPPLIIGPCNQVVEEKLVLSTIPFTEKDLDVSGVADDGVALFEDLGDFTYGKNYLDAVLYDSDAEAYFPITQVVPDDNETLGSDATAGATASIVIPGDKTGEFSTSDKVVIFDGTNAELTTIDNISYSDPDTTITAVLANSYAAADNPSVYLFLAATIPANTDLYIEVLPAGSSRTTDSILFVKQSSDTLSTLKAVITTYPLTMNYPDIKAGAEVDTSSVYFTLKDATAIVAEGFLDDAGTTDTYASIDATGKIVTLETGGLTPDDYIGMYIEMEDSSGNTERREITDNGADTVTVGTAFEGTYEAGDTVSIFILQEIGDKVINTFSQFDFDALGVEQGDVIEFANNGGSYVIASVDSTDTSKLNLATGVYHALRSDFTAESKFTIKRVYDTLDLSSDVSVKDWIALNSSVTLYSIEDNDNNRIIDGEVYINYIAFRHDISNVVYRYNDLTELQSEMDVHIDNPLGMALSIALANTETEAYAIAIDSDDQTGYATALEFTEDRDDLYTIIPLTQNSAITGLVRTNVFEQSKEENSNFRIGLITTPLQTQSEVTEGSGQIL